MHVIHDATAIQTRRAPHKPITSFSHANNLLSYFFERTRNTQLLTTHLGSARFRNRLLAPSLPTITGQATSPDMASSQDVLQTVGHEQPLTISAPTVPPRVSNVPNRQYWEKRILHNGHQKLTVSKIIDSLGLKRKRGTGAKKGSPVFFNKNVRRLADGVISITDKMPKDLAGVLDYAVSPERLSSEVARVLRLLGNEIWGAHRERSWLLQASDGLEDYPRDLGYGNEHDRAT
jgi:hypothetical protein